MKASESVKIVSRSENLNKYFNDIRSFGGIGRDREKELFRKYKDGDAGAETELFRSVARYAVSVAKRYAVTGDSDLLEDLIQEANFGAVEAIRKFDPEKNVSLISYATWWMEAKVKFFLENRKDTVRTKTPADTIRKIRKVQEKFIQDNYREPSCEEIRDILEEMGVQCPDMLSVISVTVRSLNESNDDGDEYGESYEMSKVTSSRNSYEDVIDSEYTGKRIGAVMDSLDERERRMVSMFYGIGFDYPMDYEMIAYREKESSGKPITKERCRQIVTGAVKKMRMSVQA